MSPVRWPGAEVPAEPVPVNTAYVLAMFRYGSSLDKQPASAPSLGYQVYNLGDPVAINQIVVKNVNTGQMLVMYPGSKEREQFCEPTWKQIYVG